MIRFLILLLISFQVVAQQEFELINIHKIEAGTFTTNQLGDIFFSKNNQLTKIDALTKKKFTFTQSEMNTFSIIDAVDPFRILIFNKEFNKINFIDNRLAELNEPIDLGNLGYYQVLAVCQSNSNGFWIFDGNLFELVYFNRDLNEQKKSSNISDLLDPEKEIQEVFMLEKNDYIYLGIQGQGVFLFDTYGTYIKTFPIFEIVDFQVVDHQIVYFKKNKLFFYNTESFITEVLDLPVKDALNARIEQNRIYILKDSDLYVYKLSTKKEF